MNITIKELRQRKIEERPIEIVERKGLGHPDTICDQIMDSISVSLCREYLKNFGVILHHNIDKGLLVAGKVEHAFGGGKIIEPMRLVFGDRATSSFGGKEIDVSDLAINSAKKWLRKNMRFVNPDEMVYQVELREGSAELTDIFRRGGKTLGANDTSACVGYAPLSKTEKIVLETERWLNSGFKKEFPETGEDIKIMGIRRNSNISLTIAMPLLERFVSSERDYFRKKTEICAEIKKFLQKYDNVKFELNTLDKPGRDLGGVYLTLTGTSAEDADCGQVGRGNRVNGIIALNRPMGTEAAAGKNPVSHVGKIYNVLTHHIANDIYEQVPGILECYVWLVSEIGRPIDNPAIAAVYIIPKSREIMQDIKKHSKEIVAKRLEKINSFCRELATGKFPIC